MGEYWHFAEPRLRCPYAEGPPTELAEQSAAGYGVDLARLWPTGHTESSRKRGRCSVCGAVLEVDWTAEISASSGVNDRPPGALLKLDDDGDMRWITRATFPLRRDAKAWLTHQHALHCSP
jgi:hypothetical protein